MQQQREQPEIGRRSDETSKEDDSQPADPVRQPAKDDKKRRRDQQRQTDQSIRCLVVHLERNRQEVWCVKLGRVPDHALARGRAEEREQDVFVIRVREEAVAERRLRASAFGLHAPEHRRFVESQADVYREDQQDQRHQERDAPSPHGEVLRAEDTGKTAHSDD